MPIFLAPSGIFIDFLGLYYNFLLYRGRETLKLTRLLFGGWSELIIILADVLFLAKDQVKYF